MPQVQILSPRLFSFNRLLDWIPPSRDCFRGNFRGKLPEVNVAQLSLGIATVQNKTALLALVDCKIMTKNNDR